MMFFLDILIAAAISYAIGFACGAEWKDKLLQPHLQFLRETADKWFEQYMVLLKEKNK